MHVRVLDANLSVVQKVLSMVRRSASLTMEPQTNQGVKVINLNLSLRLHIIYDKIH